MTYLNIKTLAFQISVCALLLIMSQKTKSFTPSCKIPGDIKVKAYERAAVLFEFNKLHLKKNKTKNVPRADYIEGLL